MPLDTGHMEEVELRHEASDASGTLDCDLSAFQGRYMRPDVGALYLHLPFCARKCAYCDFASRATRGDDPRMGRYVDALERLLEQVADLGLLEGCRSAYVGGGTPTLAGEHLVRLVRRASGLARLCELTCEANPDSLSDELLEWLPRAGCTRLSIGVQSTSDQELRALGRLHDAHQAADRVQAAVSTGIRVSCDLMCAIPLQSEASWRRSLEDVVSWGVGHVSVYPLAIEEGTAFGRRYGDEDPAWNDPDVQATRMSQAHDYLESRGFARYEVASYARPGQRCRHNLAYWTGVPYLGLGARAASMLTREGYLRLRRACPQLPEPAPDVRRVRLTITSSTNEIICSRGLENLHFDLELMTQGQAAAEDLMLGMRLVDGATPALLEHARRCLGADRVDAACAHAVAEGLASWAPGGSLVPTNRGWLLGNQLYGEMWDLAQGRIVNVSC
ncbi:MAG: coproporphyrinogen-III oxidase family protein [Atopobiaceae bacterium]